jgi:hypothetical protein
LAEKQNLFEIEQGYRIHQDEGKRFSSAGALCSKEAIATWRKRVEGLALGKHPQPAPFWELQRGVLQGRHKTGK